ncbi:TLR4 interactor with leucine rich repeats-like [Limulus polyphemus]|uniref:TLR4 interactor with leucine rich repeats-like n=1 Tax=Limulus polyphemus TaxID=6850 RepID=A0ABM1RVP3_LIMPO|nr:TLR4 interactor with leucine rich repeats-like [Limulus polyphemus]
MKSQLRFAFFIIILFFFNFVFGLCPYRCQCNEESLVAVCNEAKLDVVPITLNPDLRELHLGKNNIKSIMSAFSVYHNLQYLDMTGNNLVTLGKSNFERQHRLQILLLGDNTISSLKHMTFFGLYSLQILKLPGNLIHELPDGLFKDLPNLEVLDLSKNDIVTISRDAFVGLERIKILLLRDNKLVQIPKATFKPIPHLISLDLGLNTFVSVKDYEFSDLIRLQTLKLDSCKIREVYKYTFNGLKHLSNILLQDNMLNSIPTEALSNLKALRELQIGQNNFSKIQPNAFYGLKNLRSVIINSAPLLERIENYAFLHNTQLQNLVINYNKQLRYVGGNTFSSLTSLRSISLRGNAFYTLPADLLPWQNLESFNLLDNPFVCNCSLLWLLRLLQNFNYSTHVDSEVTHITCDTPTFLRELLLKDLTPEELGCYTSETQKILTCTFVVVGLAVIVIIVIILWYRQKVVNDLKIKCSTSLSDSQFDARYGQDNLRCGRTPEREWMVKIGRDSHLGRLV